MFVCMDCKKEVGSPVILKDVRNLVSKIFCNFCYALWLKDKKESPVKD